jgi:hypothetical protein
MEMEVGEEKIFVLLSTTHDKMVPTWVPGNDMEKPKVVVGYDSRMGGANLSDAYLTRYCSTRKGLKNTIKSNSDKNSSETYKKFNLKISYNRR